MQAWGARSPAEAARSSELGKGPRFARSLSPDLRLRYRDRTAVRGPCAKVLLGIIAAASLLVTARSAEAQSPGPMSAGHADMSGSLDCNKCHDAGFGVPDEKCLSCHEHQPLRDRIRANKGFHADK